MLSTEEFINNINNKMDKPLNFCFDIDDTITEWCNSRDYLNFKPIPKMVKIVNALYDSGHNIHLFTARGMTSCGPDKIDEEIRPLLEQNLKKIGLKYHKLSTHKPSYDIIIDDKAVQPSDLVKFLKLKD